jgi:hypothetical protein
MSFTVRPPKMDYPIKYRCHRCGAWGDQYDLIKKVYRCYYEEAKLIVRDLLESYKRDVLDRDSPLGEESYEGYGAPIPPAEELEAQLKRELAEEDRLREVRHREEEYRRQINAEVRAMQAQRQNGVPGEGSTTDGKGPPV